MPPPRDENFTRKNFIIDGIGQGLAALARAYEQVRYSVPSNNHYPSAVVHHNCFQPIPADNQWQTMRLNSQGWAQNLINPAMGMGQVHNSAAAPTTFRSWHP